SISGGNSKEALGAGLQGSVNGGGVSDRQIRAGDALDFSRVRDHRRFIRYHLKVRSALQKNQARAANRHDDRRIERPGALVDAVESADLSKPRGHVPSSWANSG